jgi:hypothetical protein
MKEPDVSYAVWHKSSFCGGGGNNCIELAKEEYGIAIRESHEPNQVISVHPAVLRAFIRNMKSELPPITR